MLVQKQSPGQQTLLSSETQAEQVRASCRPPRRGEGVVDGTRSCAEPGAVGEPGQVLPWGQAA